MPALSAQQLRAIKEAADAGEYMPPATVRNLLDTIAELRSHKKRWQRRATKRGDHMREVVRLHNLITEQLQAAVLYDTDVTQEENHALQD